MEDQWNSWSQDKVWKTKKDFRLNNLRPGKKSLEEPTPHCKRAAKKSIKHRSSCSQDKNTAYFKQHDLHGRVARKNDLNTKLCWSVWSMQKKTMPEAFWIFNSKCLFSMCFKLTKPKFEAKEYFWARGVLPGRIGENSKSENWKTPLSTGSVYVEAVIVARGGVTKY